MMPVILLRRLKQKAAPVGPALFYSSSFKLQVCWLLSLTRITCPCKLIRVHSLAVFLQLEIHRVSYQASDS
ncbi:hypothetical protein AM349_09015 [Citrobacter freundii]|nr:hypothetical protein AM349_09015 [Citrobacter freundii]PCQ43788.1 hypothetical protein CQA28_06440 [Citrobacter freundii]QBI31339.1 hypothetical protein WN16_20390 [Citrobacter sp. ABFQG]